MIVDRLKNVSAGFTVIMVAVALQLIVRIAPAWTETTTCTYDRKGRVTRIDYDNGISIIYTHDGAGKVTGEVIIFSEAISTPAIPSGPAGGSTGTTYPYTAAGSTSTRGHPLEYQFDWNGNGSDLSPWGPSTQERTWALKGRYPVRVRARCVTHYLEVSSWSGSFVINILDHGEIQNLAARYYDAILGRSPEPGGAELWAEEIGRILSLGVDVKEGFRAAARFFFNSMEYRSKEKRDLDFLTDLYQTFLQRAPGESEVRHWLNQLGRGLTRNMLMTEFGNSEEFKTGIEKLFGGAATRPENNLINDLYRAFLDRFVDVEGSNAWLPLMRNAQCTGAQAVKDLTYEIALDFIQSTEYAAKNRDSSQYVEDLYNGILQRGADPEGFAAWVVALDIMTREEVLQAFTNSPEFQLRVDEVIKAGCIN